MGKGRYDNSPALFAALVMGLAFSGATMAQPVAVSPATMPRVATVDERYQSYIIETAEVIGGNVWNRTAINLRPPRKCFCQVDGS